MSASRMLAPFFAACAMALISAWMVRKQFSSVSPDGVRAVVPRRQDVLVAHDHRAHLGARAGGALRHLARDGEEVLVPARALAHGTNLTGSGTKVSTNTTRVASAASRRAGSSGRRSSSVGG